MKNTVVHYIDSREFAGAEQMVLTILNGMDRNKWKPVLMYHDYEGITRFINRVSELDLETVCLPQIKSWRDISGFLRITRELKSIKPSIFHAHKPWILNCSYGILSAFLCRVPSIVTTQYAFEKPRSRRLILFLKFLSLLVQSNIAVSYGLANALKHVLVSEDKIVVIHNGINTKNFGNPIKSEIRNELGLDLRTPVILTIARLDKIKGLEYLIKAASSVPKAVFILIGDGPEEEKLKELSSQAGVNERVVFMGHRDDIAEILSVCDIFVLPSINDALPLSILEAMAAGKPVVASNIAGIDEEVVNYKTGLLVPKEDPHELAKAINSLISNPDYGEKLGQAGKIRANEEFTSEKMVKRISGLYEQLLNGS